MSTLAPTPAPHHRLHLPSKRHASQIGFLLAVAVGAVTYLARPSVLLAFLLFVLVWYVVGYGVVQIADHELHRGQWIAHVALLPVGAIVLVAVLWTAWPHPVWAVLGGLLGAVGVQWLVTKIALRGVADDQYHDLRRRMGLE
ncbi:MAG: hypothetical protein ACXVQ4_10820 [Gaiellaceae bacterium]